MKDAPYILCFLLGGIVASSAVFAVRDGGVAGPALWLIYNVSIIAVAYCAGVTNTKNKADRP